MTQRVLSSRCTRSIHSLPVVKGASLAGAANERSRIPEIFRRAKEHLHRHFSEVGLSECFKESLALMKLQFGWKLTSFSIFNVTHARPRSAICRKRSWI